MEDYASVAKIRAKQSEKLLPASPQAPHMSTRLD